MPRISIPNTGCYIYLNGDACKWLSNDRLVIYGTPKIMDSEESTKGYYYYLAEMKEWWALDDLPERNVYNFDLIAYVDWVFDGSAIVGQTQVPGDSRTVDIVIANLEGQASELLYVRTPDEYVDNTLWSPSASWMGYSSYDAETREMSSKFHIVNRDGQPVFSTDYIDILLADNGWLVLPQE